MARARDTARYASIGFAVLLVFSAAQAAWWILDQWWFSAAVEQRQRELYDGQLAVARELLRRGATSEEIEALLPDVEIGAQGPRLAPEVDAALADQHGSRVNRYLWEGGFFLLVLFAAVGVIARALRDDARLRRRQQNFLASVSHELRSPLASARVAAETLELRDPGPEDRRRQVGRILRNVTRLERMLSNLLDTVRLDEGELDLDLSERDLAEATAPVVAAYRAQAADAGVELRVEIEPGVRAIADPTALEIVLRNLLDNAFAAVEATESPAVTIRAGARDDEVVLEVEDNGHGFESDHGERLFEKFFRPGDEMSRGGRGAGLGLYIAREMVERCGGAVQARSDGPGRGACVESTWPRQPADHR